MSQEDTPIIEENVCQGEKLMDESHCSEKKDVHLEKDVSKWKSMKMEMLHKHHVMMRKQNVLPLDPSTCDRIKYALSCPPHGKVGRILTWIFFLTLLWGSLLYITHEQALPGGTIFSLFVLVISAQVGGILVSKIKLPPLLGMLLVGIIFRSVPQLETIGSSIAPEWSSILRSVALVIILTRAGLGLDPVALRKLSLMVLRLALMPCLTEATVVAIVSHLLLDFPWKWAFLLGFVLSAVSPAVVVPCLLTLAEQGYGVEKGIPTLVIAAASIDDAIAISGFGVTLGLIFSSGSAVWQGLKGPLELLMGLGYGIAVGGIMWILPNRRKENTVVFRFLILFCAGLLAVFGSKGIHFGGAGALGCLCVSFVAGAGWRTQEKINNKTQVADYFNFLWVIFQPMLFGLIGREIRVSELDVNTIGWGIVTLIIGLSFRVFVSFFAVLGGNLSIKERIFVALAWLPKATIQAAIGSTALDFAREANNNDLVETTEEIMGKEVLTIAVLVILITAPIGAAAIMLSAPKLLNQVPLKDEEEQKVNQELNFLPIFTTIELSTVNQFQSVFKNVFSSIYSNFKINSMVIYRCVNPL